MLNDLFSWIISEEPATLIVGQNVAKSYLKDEYKIATTRQRKLIAEIRLLRLGSSSTSPSLKPLNSQAEQQQSYLKFLEFCDTRVAVKDPYPSFELALEYWLFILPSSLEGHAQQVLKTFRQYLATDKQNALDFYERNSAALNKCEGIDRLLQKVRIDAALVVFTKAHATQEKALGVLPLLRRSLDNADEFAVILLWLISKGVTTENILKTHLLHNYVAYHFFTLHQEDSPIDNLFTLLEQYPQAELLIEAAKKVSCELRGFDSYSLTGKLCVPDALRRVAAGDFTFEFTPSVENFVALYQLYGDVFLQDALVWSANGEEEDEDGLDGWLPSLKQILNRTLPPAKIATLINQIFANYSERTMAHLSSLIDENTIDEIVKANLGAVLHLLPFKPALGRKLYNLDLPDFLRQINSESVNDFDAIPQLLSLFNIFRDFDAGKSSLIYEAIIDRMLKNMQFFDDESLLKKLKKFNEKDRFLAKKISKFEQQLDVCISVQSAGFPFTVEGYHAIEDVWLGMAQKVVYLNEISAVESTCPNDKHALRVRVAKEFYARHRDQFVLDDFIAALEIEANIDHDTVNEYERMLIEILAAIDSVTVRAQILEKLEEKYGSKAAWIQKKYGGEAVLARAARHGNLGLLAWLEATCPSNQLHIGLAATYAAQNQQWDAVNFFCEKTASKPQLTVIDELRCAAAESGALKTVTLLCDTSLFNVRKKSVEQAFLRGVEGDRVAEAEYFCSLPSKFAPSASLIVKAFKKAYRQNQLKMMGVLLATPNHLMQSVLDQLLAIVTAANQPDVAKILFSSPENTPRLVAVEKEFESAVLLGHAEMVNCFCSLGALRPRQSVVNAGLLASIDNDNPAITEMLLNLEEGGPSQKAIEQALPKLVKANRLGLVKSLCKREVDGPRLAAVEESCKYAARLGRIDFLQYFCTDAPIKPRTCILEQCLLIAAMAGNSNAVEYLGNKVSLNSKNRDQVLQAAVKSGDLPTVKATCQLDGPLSKGSKRIAIKKATTLGHEEIASFLRRPIATENRSPLSSPKSGAPTLGFFGKKPLREVIPVVDVDTLTI